jgi:hypothetical protein
VGSHTRATPHTLVPDEQLQQLRTAFLPLVLSLPTEAPSPFFTLDALPSLRADTADSPDARGLPAAAEVATLAGVDDRGLVEPELVPAAPAEAPDPRLRRASPRLAITLKTVSSAAGATLRGARLGRDISDQRRGGER